MLVLLVCTPWVVRNQLEVGPVGLSSVGGVNFYLAHRDSGYGFEPYEGTELRDLDEAAMSRRGYELGRENLQEHPGALVGHIAEGTVRLYATPSYAAFFSTRGFAARGPYPLGADASLLSVARAYSRSGWYVVASLAVCGWILMAWRQRRAAVVLATFVGANWICFAVVFWALPRYRFTIEPLLCIAAAFMVDALVGCSSATDDQSSTADPEGTNVLAPPG